MAGIKCLHPAKLLSYNKMFINDNGNFGGQCIEVLLDCECGATLFCRAFRGNVPKEYIQDNSINEDFSKGIYSKGTKAKVW